jgi:eukaryotic-like serine/threonine-protein kinase
MTERIGPYRIVRKLGEGGMGVVFVAEDERLGREVAIKTIRDSGDSSARERFFREARAAASLSHPNICQLYDIGDEEGRPFLVMELLEGQSLAGRLATGALPLAEAMNIVLAILTALEALHARGFIHRDLKPSNVFLSAHGVKLLDFGLARETHVPLAPDATTMRPGGGTPLTLSGMIVGTPRYMAPEQLIASPADSRTDIFAAGVLLYEMISGRPPFEGDNAMQLFHAVVYETPPNLAGSAAINALNRIIHRAMAKRPDDRYPSAAAMAGDLRQVMLISDSSSPVIARRVTRLIALPLRILRPDPETDFLAQAIPEAITTSLAGVASLIVRSSMAAVRFGPAFDPKQLAEEADVDVALTGTLLRAGEQLRVTTQLVEVPSGTVVSSLSSQATMSDLFELQDSLTQRIVESLELPLTEREARLVRRDVPASPRAHEFYLRAGQQGESPEAWAVARDLYLRAVDEDPRYAPAWARLARIYLLLGKYGGDSGRDYGLAESAARRALDLNPDLAAAHYAYAQLEASTGRGQASMLRLLDQVQRGTNDPIVFAALVTVCRFCGLLEASAAAHEQAKQLDPQASTSAAHTFWMMGRYEEAIAAVDSDRDFGDEAFIHASRGDIDKAVAVFDDRKRRLALTGAKPAAFGFRVFDAFKAAILGQREPLVAMFQGLRDFPDPEGLYYMARAMAHVGEIERALDIFERSQSKGFFCFPFYMHDAWLDPLRGETRFAEVLRSAEKQWRDAQRAFDEHPGSRVLRVGG